jgi:Family of unknown function (DUF6884)/GIY-YIG catalytic domain
MAAMTVWSMLEECISQLDEPFRRSQIIGWFRRHHPEVNEATLGAHIQAATENATNRAQNNPLGARPALLRRIDHGLYARARQPGAPGAGRPIQTKTQHRPASQPTEADVILVGCVRTKGSSACAAADLYTSPLFDRRRRYAIASGLPWFILSSKFGLLAPEDVIGPYDTYLAEQSPGYRKAWGEFVAAQLEQRWPALRNRAIEVHAGAAYVDPLRAPLAARGARLIAPLAHLRQGEQLAWYTAPQRDSSSPAETPVQASLTDDFDAEQLIRLLTDPSEALSPAEFLTRGGGGLQAPGLYSWWVDKTGAADLTRGLRLPVSPGLIYAGQAGATRWPSGRRSKGTLWDRIVGMHLGGSAEFSTFRRTLAAILWPVLPLDAEDDPRLSAWINAHLRVVAVPVPDADSLGRIETTVLDAVDPPLNLSGRPRSPIRAELGRLRRNNGTTIASTAAQEIGLEPLNYSQ